MIIVDQYVDGAFKLYVIEPSLFAARDDYKIKYEQLERDMEILNDRVLFLIILTIKRECFAVFCSVVIKLTE